MLEFALFIVELVKRVDEAMYLWVVVLYFSLYFSFIFVSFLDKIQSFKSEIRELIFTMMTSLLLSLQGSFKSSIIGNFLLYSLCPSNFSFLFFSTDFQFLPNFRFSQISSGFIFKLQDRYVFPIPFRDFSAERFIFSYSPNLLSIYSLIFWSQLIFLPQNKIYFLCSSLSLLISVFLTSSYFSRCRYQSYVKFIDFSGSYCLGYFLLEDSMFAWDVLIPRRGRFFSEL